MPSRSLMVPKFTRRAPIAGERSATSAGFVAMMGDAPMARVAFAESFMTTLFVICGVGEHTRGGGGAYLVNQRRVLPHDAHELHDALHQRRGRARRTEGGERRLVVRGRVRCARALERVDLRAQAGRGALGVLLPDNGRDDRDAVQAAAVDGGHGAVEEERDVGGVDAAWALASVT
jgi:hypothetical protein